MITKHVHNDRGTKASAAAEVSSFVWQIYTATQLRANSVFEEKYMGYFLSYQTNYNNTSVYLQSGILNK